MHGVASTSGGWMATPFLRLPQDVRSNPAGARELTVSVVIPYYDQPVELERTLAGLGAQEGVAPSDFQVVIADDGSSSAPPVASSDLDVTVVRQERRGFGLARARNVGARNADGDVLVFLDADMLPSPSFLWRHRSWHADYDHVVAVGGRLHVDIDGAGNGVDVARQLAAHLAGASAPPWSSAEELVWRQELVSSLRADRRDPGEIVLACSGGNLSITRALYLEVGGTSELFQSWGSEDVEAAHRYRQAGALVVFDDQAIAYHQGLGGRPTSAERQAAHDKQRLVRRLVPLTSIRGAALDRSHEVPRLAVLIPQEVTDGGAQIDSLLGSGVRDLIIVRCGGSADAVLNESLGDPLVEAASSNDEGLKRVALSGAPYGAVVTGRVEGPVLLDGLHRALADGRRSAGVWHLGADNSVLFDVGLLNRFRRAVDSPLSLETIEQLGTVAGQSAVPVVGRRNDPDMSIVEVDDLAAIYWAMPTWARRATRGVARAVGRLVRRR